MAKMPGMWPNPANNKTVSLFFLVQNDVLIRLYLYIIVPEAHSTKCGKVKDF